MGLRCESLDSLSKWQSHKKSIQFHKEFTFKIWSKTIICLFLISSCPNVFHIFALRQCSRCHNNISMYVCVVGNIIRCVVYFPLSKINERAFNEIANCIISIFSRNTKISKITRVYLFCAMLLLFSRRIIQKKGNKGQVCVWACELVSAVGAFLFHFLPLLLSQTKFPHWVTVCDQ